MLGNMPTPDHCVWCSLAETWVVNSIQVRSRESWILQWGVSKSDQQQQQQKQSKTENQKSVYAPRALSSASSDIIPGHIEEVIWLMLGTQALESRCPGHSLTYSASDVTIPLLSLLICEMSTITAFISNCFTWVQISAWYIITIQ